MTNLVYKNEKSLLTIVTIISLLFWIPLIAITFGTVLIYVLIGFLFFLFAQAAFISQIKGTAIKIGSKQYPEIHQAVKQCCDKVGLQDAPDVYIMRTGFFNALATRFLGKNFVVLYSDVLDALKDQPGALNFYIGHELGHIHRKHLTWGILKFPGAMFPVIGPALRRAEEYTCDRYGVSCCTSEQDIKAALAAMAAGDTNWQSMNIEAYSEQVAMTSGFWMSFNELTSDYPWLTKRVATAVALFKGTEIKHPSRSILAGLLSIFVPRTGRNSGTAGGLISFFMVIALVGVLASVAIPAYKEYMERAKYNLVFSEMNKIKSNVSDYLVENRKWPKSMQDLGYSSKEISNEKHKYRISLRYEGTLAANVGTSLDGEFQYLIVEPALVDGSLEWKCYSKNIKENLIPPNCR